MQATPALAILLFFHAILAPFALLSPRSSAPACPCTTAQVQPESCCSSECCCAPAPALPPGPIQPAPAPGSPERTPPAIPPPAFSGIIAALPGAAPVFAPSAPGHPPAAPAGVTLLTSIGIRTT